jgi:L-2-hydroxyglutarate oxidase LhgO
MMSLLGEVEAYKGDLALNTSVSHWRRREDGFVVDCEGYRLRSRLLINAGGLNAPYIANMHRHSGKLECHYAKGHYYSLTGKSPFNSLVYPVAESGGLGVHVTLDMAGQARFGPDVCWVESEDYSFDEVNRESFIQAIQAYYPSLDTDRLQPDYTGIRPKLAPLGIERDFLVESEDQHGIPGLVNLAGIESPGLTSSLAIAQHVVNICK